MSNSNTALIVDDSRVSRMMIRAIVADQLPEWEIHEAVSTDDALEKCKDIPNINLMILDFNMPGRDGLSLAEELKPQYPDAYISLLTANVQKATQEKAKALDVYFAPKPVTEERIQNIINEMR